MVATAPATTAVKLSRTIYQRTLFSFSAPEPKSGALAQSKQLPRSPVTCHRSTALLAVLWLRGVLGLEKVFVIDKVPVIIETKTTTSLPKRVLIGPAWSIFLENHSIHPGSDTSGFGSVIAARPLRLAYPITT